MDEPTNRELLTKITQLEEVLEALTKRMNDHIGSQPGASQPLTPHPTLITKTAAAQLGRYM